MIMFVNWIRGYNKMFKKKTKHILRIVLAIFGILMIWTGNAFAGFIENVWIQIAIAMPSSFVILLLTGVINENLDRLKEDNKV